MIKTGRRYLISQFSS